MIKITELIASGKIIDLLFLIVVIISALYFINQAEKGSWRKLRKLDAVDAIEEMVGRATEMGRPIHFCPGDSASLVGDLAPQTLAGMAIGKYTADLAAKYGCEMIATTAGNDGPQLMVILEDSIFHSYLAAGRPEGYKPGQTVRYISNNFTGLSAAMSGIYERDKIASTILVGAWGGATINMIGSAHSAGAMVLFGTARQAQIMWAVALADYVLIAEEMFAAAAIVSNDPLLIGSITGQDIGKWVAVALLIIGSILQISGIGVKIFLR